MTLREFFDGAFNRGESLRAELATELLRSKFLKEISRSDLLNKAVSTIVRTKEEVAHQLRHNFKSMLRVMDVPTHTDLDRLLHKIDALEKTVDRVGKRTITIKSLRKLQHKRTTLKASRKK